MLSPISAGPRPASPHGEPAGTHSAPQSGFAATRAPWPPPATAAPGYSGRAAELAQEGGCGDRVCGRGPIGAAPGRRRRRLDPEPPKPNFGSERESCEAAALLGVPVTRGGVAASAGPSQPVQGQSAAGAAAGPPRRKRQPARRRRLGGTAAKLVPAPHPPPPGRQCLGLLLPPAARRAAERGCRRLLPPVPPPRGRAAARRISEERQQQQEGHGQPQEQAVRHQLLRPAHPQPPPGRAHPPAAPAPGARVPGQPRREGGTHSSATARRGRRSWRRPPLSGREEAAPRGEGGWSPSVGPPPGCNNGLAALTVRLTGSPLQQTQTY